MYHIFKVNNKETRTTSMTSFWCIYCELWTYFTPFSSVFTVDVEQVNVYWEFLTLCENPEKIVVGMFFPDRQIIFLRWKDCKEHNTNRRPSNPGNDCKTVTAAPVEISSVIKNFEHKFPLGLQENSVKKRKTSSWKYTMLSSAMQVIHLQYFVG